MGVIGGVDYTKILTKRFRELYYSFPGEAFGTQQFGLRKDAGFSFEPQVDLATEGREFIYAHLLKAPIEFMQRDYGTFKTLYFLAQYFPNVAAKLADSTFLNFVPDTDTSSPHVANGSFAPSLGEMTFEVDPKAINFKAELTGLLYNENGDWLLDNSASMGTAGGSGTVPSGVTDIAYDPTLYKTAGFYDFLIGATDPTDSFGVRNSTKFTCKWAKQEDDELMRPILKSLQFDIEGSILQSILANWKVIEGYRNSDFVFKVLLRNGMTFIFHNCLSIVALPDYTDKNTPIKYRLKGEIPFDPIGTQSNIVFTDATQTVDLYRIGYSA